MNPRIKNIAITIGLLILSACTPKDTPEIHNEYANKIAHKILEEGGYKVLVDQGAAQGMAIFQANLRGANGVELAKDKYDAATEAMRAAIQKSLPMELWEPSFANLYAKQFSTEELASILAFYETPSGKRLLASQGMLTSEAANIGTDVFNTHKAAFDAALQDELAKRSLDR